MFDPWLHPQAPGHIVGERDSAIATSSRVTCFLTIIRAPWRRAFSGLSVVERRPGGGCDLPPATRAAVEQGTRREVGCRGSVDEMPVALARLARARAERTRWKDIRHEAEPVEVVEDRGLVFLTAALAVVVFDAKQDARAMAASKIPDAVSVEDVAEVQVSGRRGRESGETQQAQDFVTFPARRKTACKLTGLVFRSGAHLSSPDRNRFSTVRIVKSCGSRPPFTSRQSSGVETPA